MASLSPLYNQIIFIGVGADAMVDLVVSLVLDQRWQRVRMPIFIHEANRAAGKAVKLAKRSARVYLLMDVTEGTSPKSSII